MPATINNRPFRPPSSPPSVAPTRAYPPFGALRAFDAFARFGNVSGAAEALGVNPATIHRHLRTLEAWTGATLVRRSRAALKLTDEGRHYQEMLAPHMEGLAEATLRLLEPKADERLTIWCMPGFASLWLMPRLARFGVVHAGVHPELRGEELAPNFSRHEADLAIRYIGEYGARYAAAEGSAAQLPSNVRVLELARVELFPVASPEYLERSDAITRPADLLGHTLIQEESFDTWRPWFAKFHIENPPEALGPRLWQTDLALDAARRGYGIALANHFLAGDDIRAGRLVAVCERDKRFAPVLFGSYLLVARPDRWHYRPVARFRHWIAGEMAAELRTAS